ncbi:MAG TPA: DUF4339 domain-containing protein [Edaphobacter sp.]
MSYLISRAGQTYGPYTLEDLQRYVASGNILLTDLAKSDEMPDWVQVAQILNPTAPPPPGYGPPPVSPYDPQGVVAAYPDPPNLNWVLYLLLAICTCGVFALIWEFVQVLWMKRIEPATKAFPYFLVYILLSFVNGGVSFGSAIARHGDYTHTSPLAGLTGIAAFVLAILYRFAMRDSLERHYNSAEPIGLRLGPIMTFFFGSLYFQYHFNKINDVKQGLRYRAGMQ